MISKYPTLMQHTRTSMRQALKQADSDIFEDALNFLVDDPLTFSFGYIKEIIWRYIRRFPLTDIHISLLEQAALKYLARPMCREFKPMCLTISQLAGSNFWEMIRSLLDSANPIIQLNSHCLYAYADGIHAGERQRLAMKANKKRDSWYWRQYPMFHNLKELILMVTDGSNWESGQVIYRNSFPSELPIIYYYDNEPYHQYYERWLTSLDISQAIFSTLVPKLEEVLTSGKLDVFSNPIWIYTLYLLEQINHPNIVPTVINFLKQKVDYKFESGKKLIILRAAFRVLRRYDMPEAVEAIQSRQSETDFSRAMDSVIFGWLSE